MMLLGNFAAVTMGATPPPEGDSSAYLRLSNVVSGSIVGDPYLGGEPIKGVDGLLSVGDIIVRTRGPDLTAAIVRPDRAGVYATAELIVVRVDRAIADPAYVAAFINQRCVQAELAQGAQSSGLARLNRSALADLAISLPPFSNQRAIGVLALEAANENRLIREIAERRGQLQSELLHRVMEKARTGEITSRHGHITGPNDAPTSSTLQSAPKQKAPLK
jgi:hypothetical protein